MTGPFHFEQTDEDRYVLEVLDGFEVKVEGHRLEMGTSAAMQLFEQVEAGIGEHVQEGRRERRAYDAASPEERRAVLDPRRDDGPVLGHCPHGVDLDHAFCPEGCRV